MSSNISMVEASLPPGFRFHPRDDELVCDYLMKKVTRCSSHKLLLIEVDLNKSEPWDIPEIACVGGKEWYFYSQRDRKYATGLRTNRATASGYWKATGKDRAVLRKGSLVGMRKTLVFYQGRAPKGTKTDWVMHEFRLIHLQLHPTPSHLSTPKEDWVLCRVFHKNREVSGQPSVGSCSYDDTGSSCLPPLMDSNYITFDPNQSQSQSQSQSIDFHHDDYNFEQVSCFSIFSPQQDQIITNPILRHLQPNNSTTFGQKPSDTTCLDSLSCDKKVIKAVLNQLSNKIESDVNVVPNDIIKESSPSLGEQSPESYLPEVGIPINMWMWNHY